jgi:lipopolysaccharide export system protein LptA
MRRRVARLVLLILAVAVHPAPGQEGMVPRPEGLGTLPIEITADRLSTDSARNTVTFEGNVSAKQGDVTLHSDRLFAEYSRGAGVIEKIVVEGSVRLIQEGREARAARAVFFNLEQRIVLSGGADLIQGENTLKGETVTIYLRENRSVVSGGEGGRVKAVIQPKGLTNTKEKKKEKAAP